MKKYNLNKMLKDSYSFGPANSIEVIGYGTEGDDLTELLQNIVALVCDADGVTMDVPLVSLPDNLKLFLKDHVKREYAAALLVGIP